MPDTDSSIAAKACALASLALNSDFEDDAINRGISADSETLEMTAEDLFYLGENMSIQISLKRR